MRILLVDDEESIRESLGAVLTGLGHEVTPAATGEEAVAHIESVELDLILTDLYLPGNLHGLDVCGAARKRPQMSKIPIVIMSAEMPQELIAQGKKAGATDFLPKDTFIVEALKKIVSKHQRPLTGKPTMDQIKHQGLALKIQHKLKEQFPFRPIPSIASELMQVSSGSANNLSAIANVIKKDVALTARVLQMANSALYRKKEPIYTLERAVINIGLTGVRDAAVGVSLVDQMINVKTEGGFDRLGFCRHAVAVGAIAHTLARMSQYPNPEELMLCGLVHDIGMTFLDETVPKAYKSLLEAVRESGAKLIAQEQEAFGYHHPALGEQILTRWGLPESIRAATARHHDSYAQIISGGSVWMKQILMIKVADQLAQAALLTSPEDDTIEEIPQAVAEAIGLTEKGYAEMMRRLDSDLEEMNNILLMHGQASSVKPVSTGGEGKRALYIEETETSLSPYYVLLHGLRYSILEGAASVDHIDEIRPDLVFAIAGTPSFVTGILNRLAPSSYHPRCIILFTGPADPDLGEQCKKSGAVLLKPSCRISKLIQVINP